MVGGGMAKLQASRLKTAQGAQRLGTDDASFELKHTKTPGRGAQRLGKDKDLRAEEDAAALVGPEEKTGAVVELLENGAADAKGAAAGGILDLATENAGVQVKGEREGIHA